MPPARPKPSEIAVEAKKVYIPHIRHNYSHEWSPTSYLCDSEFMRATSESPGHVCRFAFYDRDPVDLALDWAAGSSPIPVIMPANEKRAGGDWEAGVMSPEECLCRRSNLYAALTTPHKNSSVKSNYPIPSRSGIYSDTVVVFRDGPPNYDVWETYRSLPIISVCPVKRPKLDSTNKQYSFSQERELMRSKLVTALRIAVYYGHENLCIGTFGLGPGFRNPVEEVAILWRDVLLYDEEFQGRFRDIVFAFDSSEGVECSPSMSSSAVSSSKHASKSSTSSKSSSSKHSSSRHSSSSKSSSASKNSAAEDLEVFRHIFKPSVVHDTFQY